MPPASAAEDSVKEFRGLGRTGFGAGTKVEMGTWRAITDAGRGGYSDPGLHGGVRGSACECDKYCSPLLSKVKRRPLVAKA